MKQLTFEVIMMCVFLVGNSGRTPFPLARVRVIGCPSLSENAQGAVMPCNILSQRFLALDLWRSFVGYLIGVWFQPRNCSFFKGGAWCCYVLLFFGGGDLVDGWMLGRWQKWRGFFWEFFTARQEVEDETPDQVLRQHGLDEFVFLFAF